MSVQPPTMNRELLAIAEDLTKLRGVSGVYDVVPLMRRARQAVYKARGWRVGVERLGPPAPRDDVHACDCPHWDGGECTC